MRSMRVTPSMVVALAALVLAVTGSAIAARHYLITSTKQIKPSVLAKLHGHRGSRGPAGAAGEAGSAGTAGATGQAGERGPAGADGATGTPGTPGADGADGSAVVARVRSTGSPLDTTSSNQAIPLTGNTWTQGAQDLDMLIGQVHIETDADWPADCYAHGFFLTFRTDGTEFADTIVEGEFYLGVTIPLPYQGVTGTPTNLYSTPLLTLFEPGTATSRTLTVEIRDRCGDMGAHGHISALALDVVRMG